MDGVEAATADHLRVGESFPVTVSVDLGGLTPADVEVQLVHGLLDALGEIGRPTAVPLAPAGGGGGRVTFAGTVACGASGQFGYCVRVLPKNPSLPHSFEPALVTWG